MKGDFTRNTFDPSNHFSRVLMQQGRVTLDADFNERTAILLHYLRTLTKDLLGPFARLHSESREAGFQLKETNKNDDVTISAGHCYVDGILVENNAECTYKNQPYPPDDAKSEFRQMLDGGMVNSKFLLWLDVWERHVSWIDHPGIREVALSGPDTCTRAEVVWQLRGEDAKSLEGDETCQVLLNAYKRLREQETPRRTKATLAAQLKNLGQDINACITAPDSRYRGLENQLYRVEIHDTEGSSGFSFKWSRDNGSVATAILDFRGSVIEVANSRGFEPGAWLEVSMDDLETNGKPGWMVQLVSVDGNFLKLDTSMADHFPSSWKSEYVPLHPKVRRWDQTTSADQPLENGVIVVKGDPASQEHWFELEDGIQVQFRGEKYRCGDYWQIPARVATGSIEWPIEMKEGTKVSQSLPAFGIEHHMVPIGIVSRRDTGSLDVMSCPCSINAPVTCSPPAKSGPSAETPPAVKKRTKG